MVKTVVTTSTGAQQLVDLSTPIIGYADGVANGQTASPTIPGAFFKGRVGRGTVVRVNNKSFTAEKPEGEWYSNRLHGGHTGSFSDGYATFVTDPGKYRDYFYPNTVPYASIDLNKNGKFDDPDFGESPSSMWYHDHGIDLTDKHVLQGAYAAYATFDDIELKQVRTNLLPGWDPAWGKFDENDASDENKFMTSATKYDQYLVLSDLAFNANGTIKYDPSDHDGTLGDHVAVNGKVYPVMEVEPTKYRFRILDGSNARFYHLQLEDANGNNPKFTGIGIDTWQFERAIEAQSLWLSPARRHDVVVDFSKYKDGDVVYLENILAQEDGWGPDGEPSDPRPTAGDKILKFVVKGAPKPPNEIPTIKPGDFLRDHLPIDASQVSAVRELEFIRQNGIWKINQIDYDPTVALSTPTTGSVERWILRNGSGGWAHPMHIHLESHQVISVNGQSPRPEDRGAVDTTILWPNTVAEILVRFRTFAGPYMEHCHILAHEDHMMMYQFDTTPEPRADGSPISVNFAPPSTANWVNPYANASGGDTVSSAGLIGHGGSHHHGPADGKASGSADSGPHGHGSEDCAECLLEPSATPDQSSHSHGEEDCADCAEHSHGTPAQGVAPHGQQAASSAAHSGLPWHATHGDRSHDHKGGHDHGADHGHGHGSGLDSHSHGADDTAACIQNGTARGEKMAGSSLHDCLEGKDGDDRLRGLSGHDELNGGSGNDHIRGGRGADILMGGAGRDKLRGGRGRDLFCFQDEDFNPSSNPNGKAKAKAMDEIVDFNGKRGDRIDLQLSDSINGSRKILEFDYIGGKSFDGAAAQIRFADGMLQVDRNGDGEADHSVMLVGVSNFKASYICCGLEGSL